ncbi:MAG: restriction endonuclease subunit S, partial [Nanoarchaeota archaeon]|nr:restriction endonuclease subunit S [Nanoarchaeota archaeon]
MKDKTLPDGWKEVALGDVVDYEQPTDYIVNSDEYNDEYKTPVLTAGKSFILGYTNETEGVYNKLPVIIFDDFTTASKFVTFSFKVKSSAMKLLTPKTKDIDLKFVFWLMQTINVDSTTHKRYYLSNYQHIKIPLPPL